LKRKIKKETLHPKGRKGEQPDACIRKKKEPPKKVKKKKKGEHGGPGKGVGFP